MKKNHLLTKAAVFAMSATLAMPATVLAAPPTSAPVEMSVTQDGKTHKVFVFGTSLALVSTDGSIEISNMGPVGRVDVMIDGNLTKNVASIDIPAGQQTKMVLDKDSVVVKNVSAETAESVKKQISDAYAAGADSVDLASLANVTAYKVNANGTLENAAGNTVSSAAIGMSVSSVNAASASFTAEIAEIVQRTATETVSTSNWTAPVDETPKERSPSSKSSSSDSSSDSSSSDDAETPDTGEEPGGSGEESGGSGDEGGSDGDEGGNGGEEGGSDGNEGGGEEDGDDDNESGGSGGESGGNQGGNGGQEGEDSEENESE